MFTRNSISNPNHNSRFTVMPSGARRTRTPSPEWIQKTDILQKVECRKRQEPTHVATSRSATPQELMEREALIQTQKVQELYHQTPSKEEAPPKILLTPQQALQAVQEDDIETFLFDCDGVIYRHHDLCPRAAETIRSLLLDPQKQVLFVSNNGAVGRDQLHQKLVNLLHVQDLLQEDQCVSSAYSTAEFLRQEIPQGGRIYMTGTDGLRQELMNHGFAVDCLETTAPSEMTHKEVLDFDFPQEHYDAVVIGHDCDFNFRKICTVTNVLAHNPTAIFVATDLDSHDVIGTKSNHIPGNGPLVKCIEASSQREAINCGKPGQTLARLIQKQFQLDLSKCLFVGDRLNSDIRFANENGMKSLLVMTGVTSCETLQNLPAHGTRENPLPHYVAPHVGFLELFE